jgi:DNA-binding MarR family transcriptional regulator
MTGLTTSSLVVLNQLVDKGPMTPKQIRGEVDLSQRTVGDALRRLTDTRLCKKVPNLRDMRQPLYYPNKDRMKEMEINLDHVRALMSIHMKVA